ncbi:hypothetical protein Daus18300_000502 [Diaporthe australafricana]|uniref:Uncharacterized protein n=1 Tax=Diaporthe australafricana TaxID=127596 RepID=A0ABR3Y3N1_9PEZI
MSDIFRACMGSIYLERASTAQLNYSAYEAHCRSVLLRIGPLDKAFLLDTLEMIRNGLHRHEIVDALQQKTASGSDDVPFIKELLDQIASLLIMTNIGDDLQDIHDPTPKRMQWTDGNLKDTVNDYFSGETDLTDMDVRLGPAFTAENLVKIAGLRIYWTADLSSHLLLDTEHRMVHIFHHVTFLECQRTSPESLLSKGLVEETLRSLALLFPSQPSKQVPSWLQASLTASTSPYDTSLHAVSMVPLQPRKREIRSFYHWHDRLLVLKQALDVPSTMYIPAWPWYNLRDSGRRQPFWSLVLLMVFLVLSLCWSTLEVVLVCVQFLSAKLSSAGTTPPSGPIATAPPSAIVKSGTHQSPETVSAIVSSVIGLCVALPGLLFALYQHREALRRVARHMVSAAERNTRQLQASPTSDSINDLERLY